jgi:hypothetical protein
MKKKPSYLSISKHYETCFDKHGDNYLGVDWPKKEDVEKRYRVMLDLVKHDNNKPPIPSLLDFGCGLGHFYDFIISQKEKITYSGLDISNKFIAHCKEKFSNNTFYCVDILSEPNEIPVFDYLIMNGVFTEKLSLSNDEMTSYFYKMLPIAFNKCSHGMAFNVMSKLVDWERDDLFHVPFDHLTNIISNQLSRHFVIRHDYGLYEYTVYVYKKPNF